VLSALTWSSAPNTRRSEIKTDPNATYPGFIGLLVKSKSAAKIFDDARKFRCWPVNYAVDWRGLSMLIAFCIGTS